MTATVTVDVGTTGVKLCVFADNGAVLASDSHPTPTTKDAWGEVYDLPSLFELLTVFVGGLDAGLRAEVRRIAFAGTGESGGLVRADISLASPMILWHDHRGADYLATLRPQDRSLIYRVTGLPANANYGISKAAWAYEHAVDADGALWMNLAEYMAASFTGQRWSEWSLASRTLALDLRTRTWSDTVCALFGLSVADFPEIRPASYGALLLEQVAAELGLHPETRVHVAGHDHMVGAVAAELSPGEVLNSTGTTEGILVLQERASLEETFEESKLANGIACTAESNTLFASIPTGGSAFATLQSLTNLSESDLIALMDELLEDYLGGRVEFGRIPVVVPQFRGAPPPTKNALARGLIAGVHSDTSERDLVFATFLGLVMQFADVLDLFGIEPRLVKVIGPASRNKLWMQLKADFLNVSLAASRFPEVVSRGAQLLAMHLTGSWSDLQPFHIEPDAHRHQALASWARRHRPVWNHLLATPVVSEPAPLLRRVI